MFLPPSGPISLTGEFQRNYDFSVLFAKDPATIPEDVSTVGNNSFLSVATWILPYISGLVSKCPTPQENLKTVQQNWNFVGEVELPIAVDLPPFDVTFLEDELNVVSKFFQQYVAYLTNNRDMLIQTIKASCMSMTLIRTSHFSFDAQIGDVLQLPAVKIPTHIEIYPRIIPKVVRTDEFDKAGNTITQTVVTFIRVPKIHMPLGNGIGISGVNNLR